MPVRRFQSLLLSALTLVVGAVSAVPRDGAAVLCLATGDHTHLSFGGACGHDSSHPDGFEHDHHDAADPGAAGLSAVDDVHRHGCVDIGLPSGDYRPSAGEHGSDLQLVWVALPAFHAGAIGAPAPHASPGRDQARCLLGLTPPDLVRSTILLI